MNKYDKIIIGAGLYGLYAGEYCGKKGEKVLILEYDPSPFMRATYINQARVHMGYHYPRSYSTAIKSAEYFDRFNKDYKNSIHSEFKKVYAISKAFSWTNADQFEKFCKDANILCETINPRKYFQEGLCDGAFITKEYTYDSSILLKQIMTEIRKLNSVEIKYNARIKNIENEGRSYIISMEDGSKYSTQFILNATYASINQIQEKLNFENFRIKYELCEIILCDTTRLLEDVGITVMDGPFFSIMPFGKTGLHSLTSVTFTPHITSFDKLPTFDCQIKSNGYCTPLQLGNCNNCPARPETAWQYMSTLAKKYLNLDLKFSYNKSLFSMKPILKASEIDDSRPTVIKQFSETPAFYSVLSGKINTIYDLEEIL